MSNNFSIYIHIPFCQKKCPYCDFNSYATDQAVLSLKEERYAKSLIQELEAKIREYGFHSKLCKSIFFGGGTPSLLSSETFKYILESISRNVLLSKDCEISVEVNPKSISEDYNIDKLKDLKSYGVNRISVGSQSFAPSKLKFLGRWHTNDDVFKTVSLIKEAGILNFNLDLIFGIKEESLRQWEGDLISAMSLRPKHISSYMLTMEPGTEFGKRAKKGEVFISDEDTLAKMYELSREVLSNYGYYQYEVSNYSQSNFECVHNLNYWEGGEYIGLGAGAHSFIKFSNNSGLRYSNTPSPDIYMQKIESESDAKQILDKVTNKELLEEYLLFGLRMNKGINLDCVSDKESESKLIVLNLINSGKIDYLFKKDYIIYDQDILRVSSAAMIYVDEIVSEILAFME